MNILLDLLIACLTFVVVVNLLATRWLFQAWRDAKMDRKTLAFLMHMELFSLCDWRLIVPEGDVPTPESEAERFRKWRYN